MPNRKRTKGERAELIAAEYFMNLGYLVARNMSSNGAADLVLVDEDRTGGIILLDVKAFSVRFKSGYHVNRSRTKKQKKLRVQLIYVNLDTKQVSFDVGQFDKKILN